MIIYNCSKGTEHVVKPKQKGKVNEMKVEQLINNRGNGAMNQFVIRTDKTLTFQSYDSTIAVVDYYAKAVVIYPDWDYSKTTGKHRNIFFMDYAHIPALATKKGIETALTNGRCGDWEVLTA